MNSSLYTPTSEANDVHNLTNVNNLTDQYNHVLQELIDKHAPERIRSITLRPNAPWFNDCLRVLKKQRRQCERKYLTTGLEIHRQIYKDLCRSYTMALNSAKSEYYKAQITKSDQNQLFHVINGLFKVKPVPPLPSYESPQSLAEDFNDYFSSKIQALRDNLQKSSLLTMDMHVAIDSSPCRCSFSEFAVVSENYTSDIIEHFKPKSCMLDPAPTQVLIQSADVLADPLTKLINASLTSGVFPTSLKQGVIHPSIKRQALDRQMFSSYRPITNIAFLSKTLERVAAAQTINYLIANHLLAKLQSAHRRFHSTETALLCVFNDISCAIDKHQGVVLVLLDLSRRHLTL